MSKTTTIDILKTAILMEKRGKAFYEKVADDTKDPGVRNIFSIMAKEEQMHIEFLTRQFVHYDQNNYFSGMDLPAGHQEGAITEMILSPEIKKQISGAGFEAAAISAAIDMESKAIEVYSKRAEETSDPHEKEFFQWLADWEKGHHKLLNEMNKELTEEIWNDNQFWPF